MPSVRGQPPLPSRKVTPSDHINFLFRPLTKALGSHNLYPLTFLWAPSQQSPSLAFCFDTKLTEVEVPFPQLSSSESTISLGRISLWTPTHSTFHPWHRNHGLGEWCWSTLFGLLSKSFASSSQYCCWWVLERGNSCHAMCEKWCRSCQYATRWCSESRPCYFPVSIFILIFNLKSSLEFYY